MSQPSWGGFNIGGSDEQMFGAKQQVAVRRPSDQEADSDGDRRVPLAQNGSMIAAYGPRGNGIPAARSLTEQKKETQDD